MLSRTNEQSFQMTMKTAITKIADSIPEEEPAEKDAREKRQAQLLEAPNDVSQLLN